MAKEISNKTLAVLLVGAIFVSLMGTFVSLNRLNQLSPVGLRGITGMQLATGKVNLSVTGQASFTTNTNVDFGIITPNSTGFWITTNTDNTGWAGSGSHNCSNISGPCQGIEIENDGNEIINITFNTTTNASLLIGGTAPVFSFRARNGNRSGAASEPGCNGTLQNNGTAWYSVSEDVNYILCNGTAGEGFGFMAGEDKITLEFNLTIPGDAPQQGERFANIQLWNVP